VLARRFSEANPQLMVFFDGLDAWKLWDEARILLGM
jgi:hypothetical protein